MNALTFLVKEKVPNVLFLIETKQSVEEMKHIQNDLHYPSMLAVLSEGRSGGLAMLWTAETNLNIQTYSPNHIDALIFYNSNSPSRLTGFYGRPKEHRRHETWRLLCHLSSRFLVSWLCAGDYNEILVSKEK